MKTNLKKKVERGGGTMKEEVKGTAGSRLNQFWEQIALLLGICKSSLISLNIIINIHAITSSFHFLIDLFEGRSGERISMWWFEDNFKRQLSSSRAGYFFEDHSLLHRLDNTFFIQTGPIRLRSIVMDVNLHPHQSNLCSRATTMILSSLLKPFTLGLDSSKACQPTKH